MCDEFQTFQTMITRKISKFNQSGMITLPKTWVIENDLLSPEKNTVVILRGKYKGVDTLMIQPVVENPKT